MKYLKKLPCDSPRLNENYSNDPPPIVVQHLANTSNTAYFNEEYETDITTITSFRNLHSISSRSSQNNNSNYIGAVDNNSRNAPEILLKPPSYEEPPTYDQINEDDK